MGSLVNDVDETLAAWGWERGGTRPGSVTLTTVRRGCSRSAETRDEWFLYHTQNSS